MQTPRGGRASWQAMVIRVKTARKDILASPAITIRSLSGRCKSSRSEQAGPARGKMERGLVFNIQKYSIQDGPGLRTTVFLKGCPLHCAWCHNLESVSTYRQIMILESQ